MLPNSQDAEELVVKWLSMPLRQYLQLGSPDMDYTQDAKEFTKSKQGDVDVGQHFKKICAHEEDRPYLGIRFISTNNA